VTLNYNENQKLLKLNYTGMSYLEKISQEYEFIRNNMSNRKSEISDYSSVIDMIDYHLKKLKRKQKFVKSPFIVKVSSTINKL
jgi:hypothetical protein